MPAVKRYPARSAEFPDPRELRGRAFAGLRELLARLGDRRTVVLAIDDLQWGDVDSAELLEALLRPPQPPVLLLVASFRSEDVKRSPFLRAFLAPRDGEGRPARRIVVDPLTSAQTCDLALQLLGSDDAAARAMADAVARESGGNPFFAAELVHHLQSGGADTPPPEGLSLDQVLWRRIRSLPDVARHFLEAAAVHGRPLSCQDARSAAVVDDERSALAVLLAGRLVRHTGASARDEIETYHDRVRETVLANLDAAARAEYHKRLAQTLEAAGGVEPEVLAIHFLGAGQTQAAGRYYARATAQAAEALAFDRQAHLYRRALELGAGDGEEGTRLRTGLADALANAGRGAEAGREYLAAAQGAAAAIAIDRRRSAAFQFLTSGHVDEGLGALRLVVEAAGLSLGATPRRALASLLARRLYLWFRGSGYKERALGQVSPEELRLLDVTWCVGTGLGMIDPIRGSSFQAHNLILALRIGEPLWVARALSMEAAYACITGDRGHAQAARLLAQAEEIAEQLSRPVHHGNAARRPRDSALCRRTLGALVAG